MMMAPHGKVILICRGNFLMNYIKPKDLYDACAKAVLDAEASGRNHIGVANAVMRTLREADRIVADHEPRIFAENKDLDEIMVEEADGTVNRYKKVIDDE
jgi:hypothetical protein